MGKSRLLNNRYQWEKMLGQGGMGKVHLMTDVHTEKYVAVKECFCPPEDDVVERIKREYYFMTKIQHPHLIQGLDFFQIKDRYFIVMEYVEGITLCDFVRDHPKSISVEKQLQIMAQICDAVATLNASGIIHRDIKPENIILTPPDLKPKILDFGIAKAINGELATITKTSNIIGTPAYITPEQIDPRIENAENLDVFSLGIVFYQFLSWMPHSPFFAGQMVSTLDRIMNSELPPLFQVTKEPHKKYISQVIAWALRKNPQERIESVRELQHLISHRDEQKIRRVLTIDTSIQKQQTQVSAAVSSPQYSNFRYMRLIFWLVLNFVLIVTLLKLPTTQQNVQRIGIDYANTLIEFSKKNRPTLEFYERGMLFFKMREKDKRYRQEALQTWLRGLHSRKNKGDYRSLRLTYQIFYVGMMDTILRKTWLSRNIKKQRSKNKEIIAALEKKTDKNPVEIKMLDRCLQFAEVLQIILEFKKTQGNKLLTTQKIFGGYVSLFFALHGELPLSKKIKYLQQSLLAIPDEELVLVKLLETYSVAGFYDDAEALYDHLQQNVNSHLLSADVEMLSIFMLCGKVHKAKQILGKLVHYEIFHSHLLQLLHCQYLFLMGDYDAVRTTLRKLPESKKLSKKEGDLKASLECALDEKRLGSDDVLLQTAKLYLLKNNIALAKKYTDYVEDSLDANKSRFYGLATQRTKVDLLCTKLRLYNHELQHGQTVFSIAKFDKIVALKNIEGSTEQFLSLLAMVRFATYNNGNLQKYNDILRLHCDDYTFFNIYGQYHFQQKRYLDAIGYWENAIQEQPVFRNYLTKKQYRAWQLLKNGE
ncbi:serine/threonine-protein kinase [Candidatus Uabimicrobium amorphum]|uniref:non-specific serine/threonine protein kinase n=1 Tax=Uabimicrobium amorphum TaxID=2596890 RepID=A0A5S9F1G7_UABAM|nr:serine/threonine-protein kinase [Candidatus Uabimicrobium amorphum]BBM82382.1 protein kinase [Candidatus Uabimicrobium amorphum]